jgi:hypothetical protein
MMTFSLASNLHGLHLRVDHAVCPDSTTTAALRLHVVTEFVCKRSGIPICHQITENALYSTRSFGSEAASGVIVATTETAADVWY